MRDLVIILLMASAYPLAALSPYVGAMLYVWMSFLVPYHLGWAIPDLRWVFIAGALTLAGLLFGRERKIPVPSPPVIFVGLLLIWVTITLQFAFAEGPAYKKWDEFVKTCFVFFVATAMMSSRDRVYGFVWAMVMAFGFYISKGAVFTILSPGGMVLGPEKTPFEGNNGMSRAAAAMLPLCFWLSFHSANKWVRLGMLAMTGAAGLAVIGTTSRGGFITVGVVCAYLWWNSRRKIPLAAVALAGLAALFIVLPQERLDFWVDKINTINDYEEDVSFQGRVGAWQFAMDVVRMRPITGGGFEVFTETLGVRPFARASHSNIFEVLGEHGPIGLFLWSGVFISGWLTCSAARKLAKGNPKLYWSRDLAIAIQASLAGYFVGGLAINFAFNPLLYFMVALAVGNLVAARRIAVTGDVEVPAQMQGEPTLMPGLSSIGPLYGQKPAAAAEPDKPDAGAAGDAPDLATDSATVSVPDSVPAAARSQGVLTRTENAGVTLKWQRRFPPQEA